MRWIAFFVLLAGCSHLSIDARSNTSTETATGARANLHLESRALAAVVVAGMFIAAAVEDAREPRPVPSFSEFADWFRGTPKLELDPERRVSEQDCTRPIDHSLGNIRCK
jgi:hypothetical protein